MRSYASKDKRTILTVDPFNKAPEKKESLAQTTTEDEHAAVRESSRKELKQQRVPTLIGLGGSTT